MIMVRRNGILRVMGEGRVSIAEDVEFVEKILSHPDPQVNWQTRPYNCNDEIARRKENGTQGVGTRGKDEG